MLTALTRVLIADDEPLVRKFLGNLLAERVDCEVFTACDGEDAYRKIAVHRPDVLITDLKMPNMSGQELTVRTRELRPDLTIVVETGNPAVEDAVRMMKEGVFDFISKPFVLNDLEQRISQAIAHSRNQSARHTADAMLRSLMAALESKDPYLKGHSCRVSNLASFLGRDLGLGDQELEHLSWAAMVHDVGKIGVPEAILQKQGPLTEAEFELIKRHPIDSVEIIRPIAHLRGGEVTEAAVYHHHERIDGRGYPEGLSGDRIPLEARIIAICDAYDAMASHRPYREALSEPVIRENFVRGYGTQFDSEIAREFLRVLDEYKAHVCNCNSA